MTKIATMAVCGVTFIRSFIAFSFTKKEAGFWRWAFEKEVKSRTKNRCMVAFLINEAHRRGMHRDVQEAYALFKDIVDAFDTKGRLRKKVALSGELAGRHAEQ